MEYKKKSSPETVLQRLQLISEGIIAEDEFPYLIDQSSTWIFLHESDPDNWPPQMAHLKKYLYRERFFA